MALDVYKDWLGIPEGPRPPDHYQLLRLVQFEDNAEKIRANYRKLNGHVRKYATGQYLKESQDLLNELAKAMLCLTDADRKREYDESLGRVSESAEASQGPRTLEQILVAEKAISAAQAKEAAAYAEARGLSMRDALVQMKLVAIEQAQQALAKQLGLSYVDLAELLPDDSVLDKIPRNVVKRHSILPLFIDNDMLLVACTDQPEPELEEELRLRVGMSMRPVIASPLAINQGIAKYYVQGMRDDSAAEISTFGKRAKAKGKAKPKTARKPMSQLSSGEAAGRKQMGILIICWATIASAIFDYFVIQPTLFRTSSWPFYLTLLVAPAVTLYVYKWYWK